MGRGYTESQRREGRVQERREENQEEREWEEYLSEGEDGRPCIKWRRTETIGRNKKKAEKMCRPEVEGEE